MAKYQGIFLEGDPFVLKDEQMLSASRSQAHINHSPDGFSWGYNGSGPAQLALALLLEETDKDTAMSLYQNFKSDIIAVIPADQVWEMDSSVIQSWLAQFRVPEPVCDD